MYAVIEDSGSQIKVAQGDVVRVALRDLPADAATVTFEKVLMISDPEKGSVQVGQPLIPSAKVIADVLSQERTPSVPVVKFKRRKTYTRRGSHRQDYLKVKITTIKA